MEEQSALQRHLPGLFLATGMMLPMLAFAGALSASLAGASSSGDAMRSPLHMANLQDNPRRAFEALDANRDGYLTGDETAASRTVHLHFGVLDTDRDRRVSIVEFHRLPGMLEDVYAE
ncbi:EF-hand domain-containing protein [uncultured Abyssibacter sp.]|uniref:EF-hand domain-containing protein n=1 Tax=uncultured Abyssibacter sp. TaxID=2320202 RepID=UPI0032B1F551